MFIVVSRPDDEDNLFDTYIVDHDTKTKEQFEVEWLKAKEDILEKNPEYNVTHILVALKRKGWSIIHPSPIKVTY